MSDPAFLIHPHLVARFLRVDQDAPLVIATQLASAMVRSYVGMTVTPVEDDVVHLRGRPDRVLPLPELPVSAVSAVSLDGQLLSDYTWRRWGALHREGGWGIDASEVVVTYSHGFARIPTDIASVVACAAARLVANPAQQEYRQSEGAYGEPGWSRRGAFVGFTLHERLLLDRYRRRMVAA